MSNLSINRSICKRPRSKPRQVQRRPYTLLASQRTTTKPRQASDPEQCAKPTTTVPRTNLKSFLAHPLSPNPNTATERQVNLPPLQERTEPHTTGGKPPHPVRVYIESQHRKHFREKQRRRNSTTLTPFNNAAATTDNGKAKVMQTRK